MIKNLVRLGLDPSLLCGILRCYCLGSMGVWGTGYGGLRVFVYGGTGVCEYGTPPRDIALLLSLILGSVTIRGAFRGDY